MKATDAAAEPSSNAAASRSARGRRTDLADDGRALFRRLGLGRAREAAAPDEPGEQEDGGEHAAGEAHARLPISRMTSTSAAPASSQATMPSGIGPMLPMPQPPRSGGVRVDRT